MKQPTNQDPRFVPYAYHKDAIEQAFRNGIKAAMAVVCVSQSVAPEKVERIQRLIGAIK